MQYACLFQLMLAAAFLVANDDPIDPVKICQHMEVLSSDGYQGRKPGTEGEALTLAYLSNAFEELGLEKPNGKDYLQKVLIKTCNIQSPHSIELLQGNASVSLEHERDYLLQSDVIMDNAYFDAVEFVFAGFGIHAPELGWDDYKGKDVKGKVVIVLADVPGEYSSDTLLWKGDPAANIYSKGFYKRNEAAERGAIALLTVFKQSKQGFYTWSSLANYIGKDDRSIRYSDNRPQLSFSGLLSREAAERILALSGMGLQEAIEKALHKEFKPINLKAQASFVLSNACTELETFNVMALLPGSDLKDECMIYSAHWDHVGINSAAGQDSIFNGAVDNASGTAALLEIARRYVTDGHNRRSVLFLATTAEEMGLLGSVWYNAYPLFPHSRTAVNFNMDSHYPYGRTSHITAVVYGRSELDRYLEAAAYEQDRQLVSNNAQNIAMDIFFRSDHFPFAEQGILTEFAVGFGEAVGHDNSVLQQKMAAYAYKYHQPSDEYESDFDCSGIAEDAMLVYRAGRLIDREGAFPMWKAGTPFNAKRQSSRYETKYFRDVTEVRLPAVATRVRTMDAKPADLDGDGDLDMVLCGEYAYNIILINDGSGHFVDETESRITLNAYDTEDVAVADFDQDGDLDLFFVSEDNLVNEFYLNDGKGYFSDRSSNIPVLGKSNAVNVMDIDGDNDLDVLIGNDGRNYCLLNMQNGKWADGSDRLPLSTKVTQDIELGDIDGDGDTDIICANEDGNEVWLNDKGTFTLSALSDYISHAEWETREIDLGDIDGDGDLDLVMANVNFRKTKDATSRLFVNDGRGRFSDVTGQNFPEEIMHTTDMDFVDIDRDGDLDIVAGNVFGSSYSCYLNDGEGSFFNATDKVFPASLRGEGIDIESGDFNGDGLLDLYFGNFTGRDYLLLGK